MELVTQFVYNYGQQQFYVQGPELNEDINSHAICD
jgi:hypothetical protein